MNTSLLRNLLFVAAVASVLIGLPFLFRLGNPSGPRPTSPLLSTSSNASDSGLNPAAPTNWLRTSSPTILKVRHPTALVTKAEALKPDPDVVETACHLDDAKVRLFGDVLAMAYGNERSTRKLQGQPEALRCLVWTDTWLKRDGKWEVIAAQDAAVPCKSAQ
jgi:hypothetical protein